MKVLRTLLLTLFIGALGSAVPSISEYRPWWMHGVGHLSGFNKIVGGFEIDISQAPFQVSLRVRGHICGGSIISKRWILTAAHCASPKEGPYEVRVGSSTSKSGGQLFSIKKVIQHPKYNSGTFKNDFALLELEIDLEFSENVAPIDLPNQNEPVKEGTMLQVSGWGTTQNPNESNTVLRAVNVPAVDQQECNRSYGNRNKIHDEMLCAGYLEGGKDSCQGDSGGPLVKGNVLVGVVSWGKGCAEAGYYGVYARVASAKNWITSVMDK
ncbi:trypsin 5G1-like [Anopheles nili]|uniref:trypsin 5G1-like n=1 Tax=Anopheles nili TaxID=185578 RepID=UPI00237BDC89|nr:trypsin 5G1-like [Anopheles nili]